MPFSISEHTEARPRFTTIPSSAHSSTGFCLSPLRTTAIFDCLPWVLIADFAAGHFSFSIYNP